jgi:predicted DNA-binding WGR domain protein
VLVAVGRNGPVLGVYAGEGVWKVIASIELDTGLERAEKLPEPRAKLLLPDVLFGFRVSDRTLVAEGCSDDVSGAGFRFEGSLAPILDALPPRGKIPIPRSDVAPPSNYALVFKDEESNKFWNATIDGASYTLQWGKRSAKGKPQSKVFTAKSPEKARADLTKKLEEKLDDGYELVAEGADVARTATRPAFAGFVPRNVEI